LSHQKGPSIPIHSGECMKTQPDWLLLQIRDLADHACLSPLDPKELRAVAAEFRAAAQRVEGVIRDVDYPDA
jgi:hypothetical protein